jgi:hypothetical protein
MAARGCGDSRQAGGIYACCGLSPVGSPIENFLVDSPIPIDKNDYGLSSKGTTWLEKDGVWHLLDIVGENYYPNVADFVEEARRMGISRRLSGKLEFERLTKDSRIILLHRRVWHYGSRRQAPGPRFRLDRT